MQSEEMLYQEIKHELISNEANKVASDYIKNRYELGKYYNVGKILSDAGKNYGEGIIKKYSSRLSIELNKKYSTRYLYDLRKLYYFIKVHPMGAQLTISHIRLLFVLKDNLQIEYYINQIINRNLSKRGLQCIINSKEYERLPLETKNKLINREKSFEIMDYIKNPIVIRIDSNDEEISELTVHSAITKDIEHFMNELGNNYSFIGSEYKIKIGSEYNYIDFLLFNIDFNCYVVVELKITELKKEHIGQIQVYINYIDNNLKKITQDKTIGIIICKKDNKYIIEYSSDKRIYSTTYLLK